MRLTRAPGGLTVTVMDPETALTFDLPQLRAALVAIGPFWGTTPSEHADALWEALRSRTAPHGNIVTMSSDLLEEVLHEGGGWAPGQRCNCGWRTREIWVRLEAVVAGRPTRTMELDFEPDDVVRASWLR